MNRLLATTTKRLLLTLALTLLSANAGAMSCFSCCDDDQVAPATDTYRVAITKDGDELERYAILSNIFNNMPEELLALILAYGTETLQVTCTANLPAHKTSINGIIARSDGSMITSAEDGTIKIWDWHKKHGKNTLFCLKAFKDNSNECLIRLGSQSLATCSINGTINLWDLKSPRKESMTTLTASDNKKFHNLVMLDNRHLATCVSNKQPSANGDAISILDISKQPATCLTTLVSHPQVKITCLTVLNGNKLAAGYANGSIGIWDLQRNGLTKLPTKHAASVLCLAQLSDGLMASGSWDRTIKIWHVSPTGSQCISTLTGHDGPVLCLKALGTKFIVSGSTDGAIKLWDLKTGKCVKTIDTKNFVTCLRQLPGKHFVAGLSNGNLLMWKYGA